MTTTVTTLQKGLPPFSPLRSQQLPGGSEILDRIQDLIKKQFDAYAPVVSEIARTLNINISGGGGGSSSSGRRVDTLAPLAGGGPLTADLTLSLGVDGTLQVSGGLLGLAPLAPNPQSIGSSLALVQELDTDAFGRVTGGTAINIGATLSNNAGTLDVAQLFDDTVMLGDLLALQRAAPATPGANLGRIWFDSTSKSFLGINESSIKTAMVQARTAVAHQFLTGVSLSGSWTAAQPDYSDLTGSVPAITQLTGDVTASGPGSVAATIGANKVTYAKIQQETPQTILGNPGASPANVQELFLGGGLEFATVPSRVQRSALTGDATASAGSNAVTVVALHETSGPTQLTYGAIPDSNPDSTVLIRHAGTSSIVGISRSSFLAGELMFIKDYYVDIASGTLTSVGGWVVTSSNTVYSATAIEYTVPETVSSVTVFIGGTVLNNPVTGGGPLPAINVQIMKNGVATALQATFGLGVSGNFLSSFSGQSFTAGDTVGIRIRTTGSPTLSGNFKATISFGWEQS